MRHRWSGRKLGRSSSHRKALMRTMVTEFLEQEKMVTTVPKAKELRSVAEKMITLGKRETLHARRRALSVIRKKSVVFKLFDTLAPRFSDRQGGYTRILRLGRRVGDGAELALLELVEAAPEPKEEKSKKGRRGRKKSEPEAKTKAAPKKKEPAKKAEESKPEAEEKEESEEKE